MLNSMGLHYMPNVVYNPFVPKKKKKKTNKFNQIILPSKNMENMIINTTTNNVAFMC